jgi:NAD(P)-dependent dehydrogenase (short-subunit alcohol dehydrogenase family)
MVTAPDGDWLEIKGLNALVAGGTRSTGRGIAEGLADAGANVAVIGGSNRTALDEAVASIQTRGVKAAGALVPFDEPAGIRPAVEDLASQVGEFDILVVVTALRPAVPLQDISVEEWTRIMTVNAGAPFFLAQAVMGGMMSRGFGRIINFGGINFYWGRENRAPVVSSKGAVVGLSRALARDAAKHGVTVNTLVPGSIGTGNDAAHPEWYPDHDKKRARQLDRVPMGRLGTIGEVVSTTLFLASPRSSFITGQELFVTGGSHPLVQD